MRVQGTGEPSGSQQQSAPYQPPDQYQVLPQQDEGQHNDVESSFPVLHSQADGPGSEERGKEVTWPVPEAPRSWISPTTAGLLLFAFSTLCVTLM